jgi:hypothetical protein
MIMVCMDKLGDCRIEKKLMEKEKGVGREKGKEGT